MVRALTAALCAVAFAAAGCGDDDEPENGAAPDATPGVDRALWPPPDRATDDPVDAARSFVEDYIGVKDPALSDFLEAADGAGEVDVHRRGEDGRELAAVVSSLSLRRLDGDDWFVTFARSAEVELATPHPSAAIGSPVLVEGRGRGFEGNIVLEVRAQYETDALVQQPVTAGSMEKREPFSVELSFDPGGGAGGAILATTGSGIAAADGFAAFPVRFRD